jgi:hypothetical protein
VTVRVRLFAGIVTGNGGHIHFRLFFLRQRSAKVGPGGMNSQIPSTRAAERLARKRSERFTYLVAAVMSSLGITSMAVMFWYRVERCPCLKCLVHLLSPWVLR